ncbi:Retrovirus-related Pol polyprotein like [Argiope bruennichi]|uniref:RNA-directed DNA polymerase n=1 Tax=Argiope bruennichi TaxID=94029 RepID=A0A8T0F714_ARGBR|nr:Retrovirus-related Pol polyprotein like [Argiope bruennichi]
MKQGQERLEQEMKSGQEELKKDIVSVKEEFSNIIQEKMNAIEDKVASFENNVISVESKVLKMEESIDKKVRENIEINILKMGESLDKKVREDIGKEFEQKFGKEIESLNKQISHEHEESKVIFTPSLATIKPSTFDGKTSWQVYKTQFTIVAEANGWNPQAKVFHFATSLRGDAADILETLTEEQRQDFQALSSALEHAELAADIQRLSYLAFSDCPVDARQDLALQHFIDSVRDPETQKTLRLADVKDIGSALVFAHKIEAAQQATRKDRHPIKAVSDADSDSDFVKQIDDLRREIRRLKERKDGRSTEIRCWTCGTAGHVRRNCRVSGSGGNNCRQYLVSHPGPQEWVSAVRHWTCPTDVHQLRSFLGLCTYYRKFVKHFSTIARPHHKLNGAKQKFIWTDECDNAFNKLKDALTSAPVLAYPEIGKKFILDTDASHECIGAVLSQEIDGQERVIAYFSKCLTKQERNYCVTRKELLAIVKAVDNFHPYLYGRRFLIRTDHASLTWLLKFKKPERQIARWVQRLQKYDMEIRHRKGSAHENADALSRRPCSENCKYFSRVEKKFGMVDPVVRQVTTPSTSESDPWSDESVRKDQLADPEIKPIIEFKESTGGKYSWQNIAPFYSTTKRYWALWDSFHLRNGVLYRKLESDDGKVFRWQLILTKTRVSTVLKELHGSPTGGPLPMSSDGNNNILVVMDYFTKWPEAFPIPDQEAPTVAEILVQNWISRYGVPLQLHSDQGRNFDSAVCRRLCEILGIDKTRTTALHPQSDGMDWDKKLPLFLLVYRSAVHETTGYSPSQMLFGRDLRLPADLLFSRPPDAPLAPEEYVENLRTRMEVVHHLATDRIDMASEKMKTRYDARATEHNFHEGDQVWL